MTLASEDRLCARVRDAFPDDLVTVDLGADDLFAGIVVQSPDQVHLVADCGQGGALTGSRQPIRLEWELHVNPETFSFLHPLDVGLETTDKFID